MSSQHSPKTPMPVDPAVLLRDPMAQLAAWLAEARAVEPSADAFALATSDRSAAPSVRMVLLRGADPRAIHFFTDRRSRKGGDLAANPRAGAVFHWPVLGRQVRLAGAVEQLSPEASEGYWATRPRGSQLSAWASMQGTPIGSRAALEARVAELAARWPSGSPIALPPFWGGYRLIPDAWEFWEGREDRLHDRVEYLPDGAGGWRRRRLQP
jgi:pyridoxamine 5'-phosphate oxidase